MGGHLAKTHELGTRRLGLIARLPSHQPRAGSEIHDILHMAVENAVSAGAVTFALDAALRFGDEDLVAATPMMVESKPIVPLVLMGRFDEALVRGERVRAGLGERGPVRQRGGSRRAMYSLVLVLRAARRRQGRR